MGTQFYIENPLQSSIVISSEILKLSNYCFGFLPCKCGLLIYRVIDCSQRSVKCLVHSRSSIEDIYCYDDQYAITSWKPHKALQIATTIIFQSFPDFRLKWGQENRDDSVIKSLAVQALMMEFGSPELR